MNKIKLYIDDIRYEPEGWTLARNISEAIKVIEMFNPSEISLDHDISHDVKVDKVSRPFPCDECFCAVARYMVQYYWNPSRENPIITFHTANPNGADKLKSILKDFDTKYIPCPPAFRKK